jgi:hypothetical protein
LKLGGGGFFGPSSTQTTPAANTSTSLFGNPTREYNLWMSANLLTFSSASPAPAASSAASPFSWNKPAETQTQNTAPNAAPGAPGHTLGSTTGGSGFGLFGAPQGRKLNRVLVRARY